MFEKLTELGLSTQDVLLLVLCPICAAIGSLVHWAILEINPMKRSAGGSLRTFLELGAHIKWIILRVFIGSVIGLVLALYFMGTINEGINSMARILAFAVLLGYSAPRFWKVQEELIVSTIEKKVREALQKHTGETEPKKPDTVDGK